MVGEDAEEEGCEGVAASARAAGKVTRRWVGVSAMVSVEGRA